MMILPRVVTWDTDDDRVSDLDLMLLLTTIAASASPTTTAVSASTSTYGIVWPCGACVSMWIAQSCHSCCIRHLTDKQKSMPYHGIASTPTSGTSSTNAVS